MKPLAILLGAALLIVGATPHPASAVWPGDPTVSVPLCTEGSNQQSVASVSDGAGGAIVAWGDSRNGASDIYAQRISITGEVLWTANGVPVAVAVNSQDTPMLVSDGAGGAIVVWSDTRDNTYEANIYAQRLTPEGAPLWTVNGVRLVPSVWAQQQPTVAADGAGGAFVAWSDQRGGTCTSCTFWEIVGQHIEADGSLVWGGYGLPICNAPSGQYVPSICPDDSGGAIVAWDDGRNASADIYAQRITDSGAVLWAANGVPVCSHLISQHVPVVAPDDSGGAIVAWEDYSGYGGATLLYAQRITRSGSLRWPARGVPLTSSDRRQTAARIVKDGASGAIVAWRDQRAGNADIYAQRVDSAGAIRWGAGGLGLCTNTGDQQDVSIARDDEGGAIFTWFDWRVGNYDIYAQRVSAAGAALWPADGLAVCAQGATQQGAVVVPGGGSGAVVAWRDHRNGNTDIFAQRIDEHGDLDGVVPLDVPGEAAVAFALGPVRPNPSRGGALTVHFALAGPEAASLELLDIAGRRIVAREVGSLGAGRHALDLGAGRHLAPGIYLVRLCQGAGVRVTRAAVLE